MKLGFAFGIILVLSGVGPVLSQENSSPTQPATITPPLLLAPKEKIKDNENWKASEPPRKDADGKGLNLDNDEDHCPGGAVLKDLGDPGIFSEIEKTVQAERSGRAQWHAIQGWAYCHDRADGRDWIGWPDGGAFHWVLLQNGRFWWHDSYAERWLSFYGGYWWWQGKTGTVQAYLRDGHYHACDAKGVLGEDLWTTGVVEEISGPPKKETSPRSKQGEDQRPRHTGLGSDRAGGAMDDDGD